MLGSRSTSWGRTQPRPSGSESEPCTLSAGRIPLHHRLLRSQGARVRGSFLQEVMSKHKPQDKRGGRRGQGRPFQAQAKPAERPEGESAWVSRDFLRLEENGRCEVGTRAGARSWHCAHLLENLGLFSEECGTLEDFCLFLLGFFLLFSHAI